MKRVLLLTILLASVSSSRMLACKCAQDSLAPPSDAEQGILRSFANSDAVFVGTVQRLPGRFARSWKLLTYMLVTFGDRRELSDDGFALLYDRRVRFAVSQVFKGSAGKQAIVYTGWGMGDCGYEFELKSAYLVYAHSTPRGRLVTGICASTKPLSEAVSDLAVLNAHTKSALAPAARRLTLRCSAAELKYR